MSLDEWLGIGLPEEIVEEAIVWVAKLDGDTVANKEKQAFLLWLDAAPEHQWAYEEISEAWSKLKALQAVKDALIRSEVVYINASVEIDDQSSTAASTHSVLSWLSIVLMLVGVSVGIIV